MAHAQRGLLIALLGLAACMTQELELASAALVAGRALERCQFSNVLRLGDDGDCSAVLVHPRVLLYPAHCAGPFGSASAGDQQLAIERCQSYPDGGLFGSDLGFCVLREPAHELTVVAPALGCEIQAVAPGRDAWVVGFGATPTEPAGTKHISRGQVQSVTEEITVSGPDFGVCAGDSGGPLLIEVDDGTERALRVAGILSASSQERCGPASAYFTPLWPFIAWVERESGFDVSPCGAEDGSWRPGPECRSLGAALLDSGTCDAEQRSFVSSTCGPIAAQSGSPKGANTASCQSVLVASQARMPGVLVLLALCAAAARAAKISRRGHGQSTRIDVSSAHEWSSARSSRGRWLRRAGLRAGARARAARRDPGRST